MYLDYKSIRKRLGQHMRTVEKLGYDVAAIVLKGSQNYGLADENSDVDSVVFVYPSWQEIIFGKIISRELEIDRHEIINIKDVRTILKLFTKPNPVNAELLYSKYWLSYDYRRLWDELRDYRKELTYADGAAFLKSTYGTIYTKVSNLSNSSNYRQDWVEKYGYDPKQLIHALRLYNVMQRYIARDTKNLFQLEPTILDELKQLKYNPLPLEEAQELAQKTLIDARTLCDEHINDFTKDAVMFDILESLIIHDIKTYLEKQDTILGKRG